MNGQPNLGHFGPPSSSASSASSSSSSSASSAQITTNNRPNIRQQGSSASSIASVAAQLQHNHHQQQQTHSQHDQYLLQAQQQQQNYLETFSPPPLPPQSPHSNNNIYRSHNSNANLIYAQKGDNDMDKASSHQQQHEQQQLQMVQQEIFLQMRQQYETQIRTLQMEICSIKSQNGGKGGGKTNRNNSNHIVDTYCEQLQTKDFECKNCAYKTKSEASLVIHNTNHLVNQRYLHLPTTVFSVNQRNEQNANPFLYPCGECSGKYSHNDLYLHIYEHHTGEHPFHCDECDLYFMHFEFLDDHQRSTHMKHPSKAKKSRYDSHHHTGNSSNNNQSPQLVYYSVVKCSKPFSVLAAGSGSGGSTASRGSWNNNSNHDSQNSHNNNSRNVAATNNNQNMMMMHSGFKPNSPMPPNFPTYGSGTWKRGRGRGGSSMASCHNNNNSAVGMAFGSSGPILPPPSSSPSSSSPSANSAAILSPPPPPPPSMHHDQIPEVFKCHFEDCFFVADAKDRLDFHLYAHQNSRFKCPHCPYVSNVLNDIKRHCVKGAKHEGAMFTCPSCEFPTNCDKTFRDHIRSIHFGKTIDDKTLTNYIEAMFQNVPPPPAAPPPLGPSLGPPPAPTSAHQQQQLKSEL